MRKFFLALYLLSPFAALGQGHAARIGYCFNTTNGWIPIAVGISAATITPTPEAINIFGQNTGTAYALQCDTSGNLSLSTSYLPLTGGSLTGSLSLTQGSGNALNFNVSDASDWVMYQIGTGASSTFTLTHAGVVNVLNFTNVGALTLPDNFFLNTGKNLFFDTAANGSQWGFLQTGTAGSATFALAHAGVAAVLDWDASGNTTVDQILKLPKSVLATGATNVSGCSLTAAAGGTWAGKFVSGTTGTCTVTITPGTTANNGFHCTANDLTTTTDTIKQTATSTTTTATIAGTTASGDVINWACFAY